MIRVGLKCYPVNVHRPWVFDSSESKKIKDFFNTEGYVVVRNVSSAQNRNNLVENMQSVYAPETTKLGFLDLYHDDTLAQMRQDPRLYKVFANLLQNKKLWVVYDRVILQKASHDQEDGLPPHVDQNPYKNPDFASLQGMIALRDMDAETGTLALIPKSKNFFYKYKRWCTNDQGTYVEYKDDDLDHFQALYLYEGDMVIWDSRTTHSRYRHPDGGDKDRLAMLVSFTQAHEENAYHKLLRTNHFKEGTGWNCPEAGLRATAKPRFEMSLRQNPERLTALGEHIYGLTSWETATSNQFIVGGLISLGLYIMFLFAFFGYMKTTLG